MPQNFFLYNNPDTGLFEWIPWDNNESLIDHPRCLSLNMSPVGSDWPLISYILGVSDYTDTYKYYVRDFSDLYFNATDLNPIYTSYAALIEDYVIAEELGYTFTSASAFSAAVSELKEHTIERNTAAVNYVTD